MNNILVQSKSNKNIISGLYSGLPSVSYFLSSCYKSKTKTINDTILGSLWQKLIQDGQDEGEDRRHKKFALNSHKGNRSHIASHTLTFTGKGVANYLLS